jgi:murein DD-endopeptidase MepM/ murein hydrolase activator NlpD
VIGSRLLPLRGAYHVTQGFGCVEQNDGYPSPDFCPKDKQSFHDGVDFCAPAGTPIVAAASGRVMFAGVDSKSKSGNTMIVIEHGGPNAGFRTEYLHWERAIVAVGQHVTAGQEIAEVGSIGYSTGSHLHF